VHGRAARTLLHRAYASPQHLRFPCNGRSAVLRLPGQPSAAFAAMPTRTLCWACWNQHAGISTRIGGCSDSATAVCCSSLLATDQSAANAAKRRILCQGVQRAPSHTGMHMLRGTSTEALQRGWGRRRSPQVHADGGQRGGVFRNVPPGCAAAGDAACVCKHRSVARG
jgi:hypothetical protein